MLVDIEKIIIKDRIRKDYGNLMELADDIQKNGLINPPAVNRDYVLLAGERRLMACKALGWPSIEVRMLDTKDAEQDLMVEISENEARKDFTMTERLDYGRRLARIESAKAKERQGNRNDLSGNIPQNSAESRDKVAAAVGMSHDTYRRAEQIVEHKDLISAEDFANWDAGKLSTNKVFQDLQKKLEAETKRADRLNGQLEHAINENQILRNQPPKVQIKEVEPPDYQLILKERRQFQEQNKELKDRIKDLENVGEIEKEQQKLETDAHVFAIRIRDFLQNVSGYAWVTDSTDKLPEDQRKALTQAIVNMDGWCQSMIRNLGGNVNGK